MANPEPIPLAMISNTSKYVLAPHIGLNSSTVNSKKISVELIYMIRGDFSGLRNNTATMGARLIKKAARKFGKHPASLFKNEPGTSNGLMTVLFSSTNPYSSRKSRRLIPRILGALLFTARRVYMKEIPFNVTKTQTKE
jgi:hypothetical protein